MMLLWVCLKNEVGRLWEALGRFAGRMDGWMQRREQRGHGGDARDEEVAKSREGE